MSVNVLIKIIKVHDEACIPMYAHNGDAGLDLYAIEEVVLEPHIPISIPTGIKMEIPNGYVGLVWDKSGLAIKHGLKTLGGVVDAGYRGEVMVGIINIGKDPYVIKKCDKVAQMLIQKIEQADIEEVAELSDTKRGEGGFGSTGK